MKTYFDAALAAGMLLLAGCVNKAEEEKSGEIRIDAFSHYWESRKAPTSFFSQGPGWIVTGEWQPEGYAFADSLILGAPELDQTSLLPLHSFERVDSVTLPVYRHVKTPKHFTCRYENNGRRMSGDVGDPLGDYFIRSATVVVLSDSVTIADRHPFKWFAVIDAPSTIELIPCGYLRKKGFYFGNLADGDDAPPAPGGTVVIEYEN
jgi:hypothetical protein